MRRDATTMRKVLTLVLVATATTADETIPGVRLTRDDTDTTHTFADLWHDAGEQQDWVVQTRRELHRTPELLFDEKKNGGQDRASFDGSASQLHHWLG